MPDSVLVHSKNNHAGANPIIFKTTNGIGTLTISTNCSQIALTTTCGNGATCIAHTVPGVTGTCTYAASVNGSPSADPIIVTDNCCPSTTDTFGRP